MKQDLKSRDVLNCQAAAAMALRAAQIVGLLYEPVAA